jgi:hypothetical protein
MSDETMDRLRPWEYFDGASQNEGQLCGGGVILHLSNSHHFKIKMGLGPRRNNFAKLMALKLLLTFVGEKWISNLQIFGDLMVVINWIRKFQKFHNIKLLPLLEEVFIILDITISLHVMYTSKEIGKPTNSLRRVFTWLMGSGK